MLWLDFRLRCLQAVLHAECFSDIPSTAVLWRAGSGQCPFKLFGMAYYKYSPELDVCVQINKLSRQQRDSTKMRNVCKKQGVSSSLKTLIIQDSRWITEVSLILTKYTIDRVPLDLQRLDPTVPVWTWGDGSTTIGRGFENWERTGYSNDGTAAHFAPQTGMNCAVIRQDGKWEPANCAVVLPTICIADAHEYKSWGSLSYDGFCYKKIESGKGALGSEKDCLNMGGHLPGFANRQEFAHFLHTEEAVQWHRTAGWIWLPIFKTMQYVWCNRAKQNMVVDTSVENWLPGEPNTISADFRAALVNRKGQLLSYDTYAGGFGVVCQVSAVDKPRSLCSGLLDMTVETQNPVVQESEYVPPAGLDTQNLQVIPAETIGEWIKGDSPPESQAKVQKYTPAIMTVVPEQYRGWFGMDATQMLRACTLNGVNCNSSLTLRNWYDNAQGTCVTFSVAHRTEDGQAKDLKKYELSIALDVGMNRYMTSVVKAGLKVLIHKADQAPVPESMGYEVATGRYNRFFVEHTQTVRTKDCSETIPQPFFYNGTLTVLGCLNSCVQEKIIQRCGCGHTRFPRPANVKECGAMDEDCAEGQVVKTQARDCGCQDPCSDVEIKAAYTTTKMRTGVFKCPKELRGMCPEKGEGSSKSYVDIRVRSRKVVLTEYFTYTIISFVSDAGGQMGIFLTFSVISLVETVVGLTRCIFCISNRKKDHPPVYKVVDRVTF